MLLTNRIAAAAAALALAPWPALAQTPSAAPAAASPAKKELVARVMQLYQGDLDRVAVALAENPAMRLMQQAGARLQALPQDRREALARDIEADVRKYAEEARPIVTAAAQRAGPAAIAPLLEERMSEEELRQVIAMFDAMRTPGARRFQQLQPDVQRVLGERIVVETRTDIEPKVRAMERAVAGRLGVTPGPAASAPRGASAASTPRR